MLTWSPDEELTPDQIQYLVRTDGSGPTLEELQRRTAAKYEWNGGRGENQQRAPEQVAPGRASASAQQDRLANIGSQIHTCVIESAELSAHTGVVDSSPLKKLHGLLKTLMTNGKVYTTLRTDSNTPM